MRKLTFLAGFIFFSTVTFGQSRKPVVGLEIGPKVSITNHNAAGIGIGFGTYADLPVYRKLSISSGLQLSSSVA